MYYKFIRFFSIIKRFVKYNIFYRLKYKINVTDCWSLDCSLAVWLYPRLVHFRNNLSGHPSEMTYEEWKDKLDKMIYSFKFIKDEKIFDKYTDEEWKKVEEGLDLFRKYYFNLWD